MQKKLSTLALLCLVAVVAFLAGTMYSSATASQSQGVRRYIGAAAWNGSVYAVYELDGKAYRESVYPYEP